MCQTLSQAYSHQKCVVPHLRFMRQNWGLQHLQLYPYSHSLGGSFELLTLPQSVHGPRYCRLSIETGLVTADFPSKCITGVKMGQNREKVTGF